MLRVAKKATRDCFLCIQDNDPNQMILKFLTRVCYFALLFILGKVNSVQNTRKNLNYVPTDSDHPLPLFLPMIEGCDPALFFLHLF